MATTHSNRTQQLNVWFYSAFKQRDVAQPGSALDWGSRGRKFKSCRPDARF